MTLTSTLTDTYSTNGFVVVQDLVTDGALDALRERIREYTHGGRSCDGLALQVEPRVQRGELSVDHSGDGIRKIDYLVQHDELFRSLALSDRLLSVVKELLGPDLKLFRNSLMLKPPEVGSPKGWHQDSPYWPIEPMELCSCWLPFDDATEENGCMSVLPGWHRRGPLPHVSVTDDFVISPELVSVGEAVTLPMNAGSGLFFHSLIPHFTGPNRSKSWRRAMVLSYMSSRSRHTGESPGPSYFPVSGQSFPGCVQ